MTLKRKLLDGGAKSLIWFCAFVTTAILVWLIVYIMVRGLPYVDWHFITSPFEPQTTDTHGIMPMILTTLYIIALTLLFAAPIGIFSAIYLVEYSKEGPLVRAIRFTTESLSGIPSIIFGLFGYIFFVTALKFRYSMLAGSLTLAITVLPTIIRTTEESLKTVPLAYKEGSLALGATKLYTLFRVVLPSAIPGIVTALILSIGRIVGETAAVFLTAGMAYQAPKGIMDSGRTLAVHLYALISEPTGGKTSFNECYATAAVLVVLVLLINFAANIAGRRLVKRIQGI